MNVHFEPSLPFDPLYDAGVLAYNTQFRIGCDDLPLGVSLQKVVLMAPGSTTHHSDMSMRYVEMPITPTGKPHVVDFTTPLDDRHAPRGIYMLFLVASNGAISEALWVYFP